MDMKCKLISLEINIIRIYKTEGNFDWFIKKKT